MAKKSHVPYLNTLSLRLICLLYGEQSDLGLDNISCLKCYLPHLLVQRLVLWFSHITIHQNHLEGLLNHSFLEWTPSFWFGMSGVGQWTLPNQFPGDADPAGTTWRTIDLHDLCPHPHSQPLSSASTTLSSLCLVTFYYSLLTLSSNMASSL